MTNKEKYKKAFDVLASSETITLEVNNMLNKKKKRSFIAMTTAVAIAFGTLTICAAAYINWNNGLTEKMHINEEQQKMLEDTGMVAFSDSSSTDAGVTVKVQQSITDNYFTYLSFKIEDYELVEGKDPYFESVIASVDGRNDLSWTGSFYAGMNTEIDDTVIDHEQTTEEQYVRSDGSLEYHMLLTNNKGNGFFMDKPIHIEFENIGIADRTNSVIDLKGKWTLDWKLGGSDISKNYKVNEILGDTGATVKELEISPVSIRVTSSFPRTEIINKIVTEEGVDQGTVETYPAVYKEPPYPTAIKFKDGTILKTLYGGLGYADYENKSSDNYVITYAFNQVIDIDEVESILFTKEWVENLSTATEDDYYCVRLE